MRGCPCLAALKWHTPECRSFAPWFKGTLCLLPEPPGLGWVGFGGDGGGTGRAPPPGVREEARAAQNTHHTGGCNTCLQSFPELKKHAMVISMVRSYHGNGALAGQFVLCSLSSGRCFVCFVLCFQLFEELFFFSFFFFVSSLNRWKEK